MDTKIIEDKKLIEGLEKEEIEKLFDKIAGKPLLFLSFILAKSAYATSNTFYLIAYFATCYARKKTTHISPIYDE